MEVDAAAVSFPRVNFCDVYIFLHRYRPKNPSFCSSLSIANPALSIKPRMIQSMVENSLLMWLVILWANPGPAFSIVLDMNLSICLS